MDDPITPRNTESFPVDRPVEALLQDHNLARKLADAYLNDTSMAAKKQAAIQLVQALHAHSRLEESVFYPGVRRVDPNMISHFEEEHQKLDDVVATLMGMTMDEPQADQMVREMINMALHHIQEEEDQFFPKLQQANIDMTPIGLEMQSFEANLVHTQTQVPPPRMRR
ncbi:hemerythrin domain-containing protein [Massilia horti]|uniref:Hemerythrin domain-containing protein n=1 Tax=Massilia horti TaxID=2562153 RepID=A0A4Y9T4U2_9BURK|nr:hemerythrin domain-containing protein [Massilia horti]TFW35569.1 hemerythrin domain-containing protein [Massilia horti]